VVALAVVFPVGGSAPVYLVGQAQVLGRREQKGHEGKVFPQRESEGGWSLPERRRRRRHFLTILVRQHAPVVSDEQDARGGGSVAHPWQVKRGSRGKGGHRR
jgi:hypothetical protein